MPCILIVVGTSSLADRVCANENKLEIDPRVPEPSTQPARSTLCDVISRWAGLFHCKYVIHPPWAVFSILKKNSVLPKKNRLRPEIDGNHSLRERIKPPFALDVHYAELWMFDSVVILNVYTHTHCAAYYLIVTKKTVGNVNGNPKRHFHRFLSSPPMVLSL